MLETTTNTDGIITNPIEYDSVIKYLEYENNSDLLSLPLRLRERHLTIDTTEAWVQAIGTCVNVMVWSDRDNIMIFLPVKEFITSDITKRKMSGPNNGLIAIGQFENVLENDGDSIKCSIKRHDFPKPE